MPCTDCQQLLHNDLLSSGVQGLLLHGSISEWGRHLLFICIDIMKRVMTGLQNEWIGYNQGTRAFGSNGQASADLHWKKSRFWDTTGCSVESKLNMCVKGLQSICVSFWNVWKITLMQSQLNAYVPSDCSKIKVNLHLRDFFISFIQAHISPLCKGYGSFAGSFPCWFKIWNISKGIFSHSWLKSCSYTKLKDIILKISLLAIFIGYIYVSANLRVLNRVWPVSSQSHGKLFSWASSNPRHLPLSLQYWFFYDNIDPRLVQLNVIDIC